MSQFYYRSKDMEEKWWHTMSQWLIASHRIQSTLAHIATTCHSSLSAENSLLEQRIEGRVPFSSFIFELDNPANISYSRISEIIHACQHEKAERVKSSPTVAICAICGHLWHLWLSVASMAICGQPWHLLQTCNAHSSNFCLHRVNRDTRWKIVSSAEIGWLLFLTQNKTCF